MSHCPGSRLSFSQLWVPVPLLQEGVFYRCLRWFWAGICSPSKSVSCLTNWPVILKRTGLNPQWNHSLARCQLWKGGIYTFNHRSRIIPSPSHQSLHCAPMLRVRHHLDTPLQRYRLTMRELLPVLGLWTFPLQFHFLDLLLCLTLQSEERSSLDSTPWSLMLHSADDGWLLFDFEICLISLEFLQGGLKVLSHVRRYRLYSNSLKQSSDPFRKLTTKNLGKGAANKHGSLSFNLSTPTAPQPSLPFCWLQLEPVQSFQSFQWTQTRSWEVPRLSVESYRPFPIVWRTLVNM